METGSVRSKWHWACFVSFAAPCEYSGVVEHLRRFKLNSVVGVN